MAAPRKTEIFPQEIEQQPGQPSYVEEGEEDFSLPNVLAELGSGSEDAKVNVYQIESGKPNAFVDSFSPGDFSLEGLKQTYGAGTYHIQVRANGRIVTRRVVRIAKPANPTIPLHYQPPMQDQNRVIEAMQKGFQEMGQMFANALGQLAQNQPKPKSTLEQFVEFQLMKEVFGGNQQSSDPMKVIELAKEFAGMMNPQPADENSLLMEGIKTFGPLLSQQLNGAPQVNHQPRPVAQLASGVVMPAIPTMTVVPPIQPVQPVQPAQDAPDMIINMYIRTLVANAKADNDPVTYANVILDLVGEETAKGFISRPDWFDEIVKRNAEAAPYREWFEELKNAIFLLTNPEIPDNKQSETETSGNTLSATEQRPIPDQPGESA
jgi:hypothetical protein